MPFRPINFTPGTSQPLDQPIPNFGEWQNVGQVKAAIQSHELGIFDASSQVVDAMTRDDRIDGCLGTRVGALPALPMTLEERGDKRRSSSVLKDIEESFEDMYPDDSLKRLLQWAVMAGVGIGQNLWRLEANRWVPRLKVWHPRNVYWRWDSRSFWVSTLDGPVEIHPGDGQWVVLAPNGLDQGWMGGKVRSLYVSWLIRQWGMRDFARYSEVHGIPLRKAKIPAGAEEDDKQRFLQQIANFMRESVIRTPQAEGAQGEWDRYDVELVEAVGRSEDAFDKLLNRADANVAISLLGQNLTTEVKGGSFAAAMGHMQIRNDVLQADAENLANCLREQALAPYCLYNYGSAELAPIPRWRTKPPDDQVQKGLAMKNLGDGALALKKVGVKVDLDKMTKDAEVPTTGPADDVDVSTIDAPAGAGAAPGAGGGSAPRAAKLPRPVARASAAQDDLPDALVEGQLYADDLTENGAKAAAKVVKPDLRALLTLVEKAESFEQLSKDLRKLYGKMSRKAQAKLLKDAMKLAELAGREAVLEEAKE